METNTATLWELWVDPVRRIVSFHPEAVSYTHLDVYKRQALD